MKKPSNHDQASLREKIIGLGEHSVRKHYYTSLQEHLDELERFRALLDQSREMIFLGKEGRIIDINQAVASFFKLPREKLLHKSYEKLFPECIQKNITSLLKGAKRTDTVVVETEIKKIPVEFTLQVTQFQHETYMIIFAADISARKKAEEEIHRLGNYDPLTHLPNRNMLNDRLFGLTQACAKEKACGEHCKYSDTCKYSALLFIDIDNFKTLNDTEGHSYGDNLLKEIARRLNTQLSRGDFLSRFGGDEFVVLMESVHTELTQTIDIVESFAFSIKSIINQPYFIGNTKHFCTTSVGIVIFHKKEADEALKQAEIAMYEAKKSGRNTIQFYDPKMQEAIKHKVSIENNLKRALQKEEFELFFQPQVNSRRKTTGFEALIRWNDPQNGLVSPAVFIPLAEDNGMIVPIGTWVIKTACLQLAQWALHKKTASFTLSINISIKQLQSKHFVATVARLLEGLTFPREKLIFEITESLFMHDMEAIVSKMRAIMKMGVHFSIDDFGTGYSSLSAIKKLPLEELKIDQSFVQDIEPGEEKTVIVNTIIGMAKNLNLRVVAEGVETEAQFDFLKKAGCNTFQGYLFGKPLPLHKLFEH